ncbi:MAG TPA: acyl-CoA dehydrogenase family protein [Blastocatellia bacterium]|nr:acyl-CoA dehydrogenase family protein [Blastocatellia bacterium]HMV82580.1 acyl-CoA dehydrogenase family protein [Blastocatellia bacterium]HMX26185.1 acyl-CoA dehydrogenase family protein [Blastocatellia bacterium]HMZ18038.1 acyl-CoA dehydrogenase family protein [Blastocatellia bacterium]HNG34646.1 acyl-CoA dehydrogenase family protein [Blastocatellia bacterium]
MAAALGKEVIKGGAFLLQETLPISVYSPEDFNDEQKLIGQTTTEFFDKEIIPNSDKIESKDYEIQRELIKKGADLGLINASIPEEYEGLELDHVSNMLIAENMSGQASFSTGFGATSSIGLLPIVLFGTHEQKKKYLPKIGSGEWIGAYCLSESGSGSDALAAKSTARLSEDGQHWILNGEKMWITNGGFGDVFTVFAKVDGQHFTGFIVERNDAGLSNGNEEHKLGQRGSSTTPILMQDCKIPKDRLLGEIGKGHLIAFNVLNFGRIKMGAGAIGGGKRVLSQAAKYAAQRHQFGRSIATFGAIKYKLAEMLARLYAGESAVYRTAGMIETKEETIDKKNPAELMKAIEEYAIECAIIKVAGTETLFYCADENVQIHGGNGFTEDYPAEGVYRDCRVNRIYEGTNEINRLLIPGQLIKRAMKGGLPLFQAAMKLQEELLAGPSFDMDEDDSPLANERKLAANAKKIALMLIGSAAQKFQAALTEQQMILSWAADVIIEAFQIDSAIGRTIKLIDRDGADKHSYAIDATRLYTHDAILRIEVAAKNALAAIAEGDELRVMLVALRRLTKQDPINTAAIRERLADKVVEAGGYIF